MDEEEKKDTVAPAAEEAPSPSSSTKDDDMGEEGKEAEKNKDGDAAEAGDKPSAAKEEMEEEDDGDEEEEEFNDESPPSAASAAKKEGEDEKKEEPKDETTTKKSPASGSRQSRRERKSIDVYVPEEMSGRKKEIVIPEGSGEKLSDMPNVVENLKAVTWSDPNLKKLYGIVFGVGKKKEFRNHLLQFNGLVYPDDADDEKKEDLREAKKEKMYKLKLDELKAVMDLCDINRSAESFGDKTKQPDKEALCIRFLEWLEKPKASGKKRSSSSSKGKAGGGKKRKSTTPTKKKKKTSASTPSPAKKAKKEKAKTPASSGSSGKNKNSTVEWNVPGVSFDKVRDKVQSIVTNGDKDTLTVKSVRVALEDWLDTNLSEYKDAVRSLAMEFL